MADSRTPSRAGARAEAPKPKKKGKQGKGKKKVFTLKRVIAFLFFSSAVAVICGIVGYLLIILNGERVLAENQNKFILPEASTIYDANGEEVAKLYRENREFASFNEIPELLKQAVVATEDKRFEDHSGVDLWAIGRALVKDVIARSAVEGGSTITQQLAKNMFLTHDKTFFRKATEASIALALETKLSKDEILELYLNRIYFGKGLYGIKSAAEYIFSKDLDELELWEIATLAGMPKAPNAFNPMVNPERSKERRAVVLQVMYNQGIITLAQMEEAKAKDYDAETMQKTINNQIYPAFIDYVIQEAIDETGLTEEELRLGGFQIHTTLNVQAQKAVEAAFADAANFEESIDERKVEGAMVILDHRSGAIQAIAGGRDYEQKGFNRAIEPRQPGSAFKPIIDYAPALDTGDWFPWSTLRDDKKCYGNYCPTDSNKVKHIGPISMRQSLKESRNASAVWLLNEIGVKTGMNFAEKLGFKLDPKEDRNLAIALGGLYRGVSPMQMALAYGAFANNGKQVAGHTIKKIVDKNNNIVHEFANPKPEQLMKVSTAWYMTEMLQSVLESGGTGTRARISRPVAGKTGTTQHGIQGLSSSGNRDVWFVGYTPEWSAAIWMGYDKTDADHLLKNSSGQAASLFALVMEEALKGVPKSDFVKPSSLEQKQPPLAVEEFAAEYDETASAVRLSWQAVFGDGITYRIYRKSSTDESHQLVLNAVNSTNATDIDVVPGEQYEYYITAYNAADSLESAASSSVAVLIPAIEDSEPEDGTGEEGLPPGEDEETVPPDGENGGSGNGGDNDNGSGNNGNGDGSGNGNNGNGSGNGNGEAGSGNGNGNGNPKPPKSGGGEDGAGPGEEGGRPEPGKPPVIGGEVVTPGAGQGEEPQYEEGEQPLP